MGGGGGGVHTGSNNTVMAFSPRTIVGCLLKKKAYKGGVTGTSGPLLATPLNTLKIGLSNELLITLTKSRHSMKLRLTTMLTPNLT